MDDIQRKGVGEFCPFLPFCTSLKGLIETCPVPHRSVESLIPIYTFFWDEVFMLVAIILVSSYTDS